MTPVRVAAVGVGGWGRVLADATRQGTGLAIVACTSRSADNRAAFAKAYGCRIHPSFEAVLADPHVIDDATSILFEFASGSLGYLGTSWVHANRTAVITVHGTEAQAWSEADGTRLFLARRGQAERIAVPLTAVDPVVDEPAEFARCVRDGATPEVGGEEATASQTGHAVRVDGVGQEAPRP